MVRPTKKDKMCPTCGKPRDRLYRRTYDPKTSRRSLQEPFGWICYGEKEHPVEITLDDTKGVYRWQKN